MLKTPLVALGLGLSVAAFVVSAAPSQDAAPAKVDFKRDVQPIFRQHCVGCHGPTQQMNGFRLDRRRDAMRGGTIPVIGPGNSAGSRLYLRVAGNQFGQQMPPTGALQPDQIALVKAWIDQGAEWPDDVSGDAPLPLADPGAVRLNDALRAGDRAAFRAALSATPASARAHGNGGVTPLMTATLYADVAEMQALLDAGADPNTRNHAGATALMWAVSDLAKTRLLLERGAEADAKSDNSRTPLMIAAGLRGSDAVVKLLLDKGANPSTSGPSLFGVTNPLSEAADSANESVFRLLVERGGDLKTVGPFALPLAKLSGCEACAAILVKAVPPPFITIAAGIVAPPLGDARLTKDLLALGADVNARGPDGRPLIVTAASSDVLPVETVRLLIDRGADIHAKGPDGETALDGAMLRGQTAVVDILLKAGAKNGTPQAAAPTTFKPADSPRSAVTRSLPILQRTDAAFLRKAGCVSCHNNTLTALTVASARQRGLPVDAAIASQSVSKIATFVETWRDRALQNIGIPGDADTISYILLGLAAENHPPDPATDAMAHFLKGKQRADGRWAILAHRPPIESSDIEVTASTMRALQIYAPRAQRAMFDQVIRRAATWLKTAPTSSNEDHAYKVLGLHWAGADRAEVQAAAKALIATQRTDGGWAQIPTLSSDAYATGQALVALGESQALSVTDPAFQRGVQYLMKTQLDNGTWFVKSRAVPLQPQFDAEFPYGRDSWISAAATNWAARALTYAVN